jgi:chaperone modulatory protein CbpM
MTLYYSEEEVVVTVAGLTRARLTSYVEAEIVLPVKGAEGPVYRQVDVARLQLLAELTEHFDLSDDGLAVVMRLVDQVHALRSDLRSVLTAITQEPEDVRARLARAVRGTGG